MLQNLSLKTFFKASTFFSFLFLILGVLLFSLPINAQQMAGNSEPYEHSRVRVLKIIEEKEESTLVGKGLTQKLQAIILDGSEKGKEIELNYSIANNNKEDFKAKVGDELIVSKGFAGEEVSYNILGYYRLPNLIIICLVFLVVVLAVVGWKGLRAVLGLLSSVLIVAFVIIPMILAGHNPFWVAFGAAILMAVLNLYLSHGFSQRTSIALLSVLITIFLSAIFAPLIGSFVRLFGIASDEAFYLQAWEGGKLDLQGLFLAGIIIGTLGVLDDVATAQVAAVDEIHKANPFLQMWDLYHSGLSVGKEHILSMVNTLALAYVGISLPMLLSFVIVKGQPWWAILSSDLIAEELVRTLVGSFCLVLAVPICNLLAAYWFTRRQSSKIYSD